MEKLGTISIGIDIGVKGSIGAITKNDEGTMSVIVFKMPIIKMEMKSKTVNGKLKTRSVYDEKELRKIFTSFKKYYKIEFVCIERPLSMPGLASFNVGAMFEGFGFLRGLLSGLNIKYSTVMPNTWTKELLGTIKKKEGEKLNAFKKRKKQRSLIKVKELIPNIENIMPHKLDDGIADALLIALWRSKYVG